MSTKKGKAKLIFAPIPDLTHPVTEDFREQIVERLKQDNWAINRIVELLMEKRLENHDRISRIEMELQEVESDEK